MFHISRSPSQRRLHNNPLIVSTIIGRTLSIITPEEDVQTLIFIGDVGHYFDLKLHYNLNFIFTSFLCLSFQLIHYLNHTNGIQNKFIGETPELSNEEIMKLKILYTKICKIIQKNNTYLIPIVCVIVTFTDGLTDEQHIRKLVKTTKIGYELLTWNNYLMYPIVVTLASILIYILYVTSLEVLKYGIPNSLSLSITITFCCNIIVSQFLVFYIMCLNLKFKINSL